MDDRVKMSHGGGGTLTRELVERVFLKHYAGDALSRLEDSAVIERPSGRVALTTDAFVVKPLFFKGGDIGRLAVCGTVNDLAMAGARPTHLTAGFVVEEGLSLAVLERVAVSMAEAAREAGVEIAAGDTKVVERGAADELFVTTAGLGVLPKGCDLGPHRIEAGDAIVVSGFLGDHGVAVLSEREGIDFESAVASDVAPLGSLVAAMVAAGGIHALRDPTRGGAAAALNELALAAGVGVELTGDGLPVRPAVQAACDLLGLDPLTVANEGKVLAFVSPHHVDDVLAAMRDHPLGQDAALAGEAVAERPGLVVVATPVGGRKVVEMPYGEGLPRIC